MTILTTKAGARCQGSEIPEVRANQPQEAACKGCGGQRDAAAADAVDNEGEK